jgi:hypothetical protein
MWGESNLTKQEMNEINEMITRPDKVEMFKLKIYASWMYGLYSVEQVITVWLDILCSISQPSKPLFEGCLLRPSVFIFWSK